MRFAFLPILAPFCVTPALAQADDPIPAPITVVATGSATRTDDSGRALAMIGEREIEAIQGPDLTRVLERAPGVTITRNGGLGGFTAVRVRGAGGEQLLVLVDGVRVADVAAPSGGTDLGQYLAGEIARAELLRGSNSVVWGSDAIGGVLALTTREPAGLEASAEYGAHDTISGQAGWGVARPGYVVRVGGGYTRSDGISAAAAGVERDGFRHWNARGSGEVALIDALALTATARYADARLGIDGFPAPTFAFADTPEIQDTRQASGRVGARYERSRLTLDAGYALADTRRELGDPSFSGDPYFTIKGRSGRAELVGRWQPDRRWTLDFGADRQRDRFVTGPSFGSRGRATLTSGHALLGWHGQRVDIAAGARIDDHSRFGGETTLGGDASLALGAGWRLRASYGEGFKAPTLFQLLSDFGNPELGPERSRGFDAGIERGHRGGALHVALSAFRRDTRDQIDFASCFGRTTGICAGRPFGTYDNIARTRAEGFEAELGARVSPRLSASAAFSHVRATDRATGSDLARRPRHALTVASDWLTPLAGVSLGADVRVVSDSFDDAGERVPLDGNALATVRARVPLGERLELYGRVENLFDADYQTAAGYGTYGRSAYLGARLKL